MKFVLVAIALASLGIGRAEVAYVLPEDRAASPGGTTYFIDPAEGDDGNSGLAREAAWKTFHRLNRLRLAPGDAVEVIAPGKFDHTLALSGAGTAEAPIKVRFAPGRYDLDPVNAFRATYQISNTNADSEGLKAVGLLLNEVKHLELSGPSAMLVCRGKMMEVCVDQCEDVVISGLAFDYHRPTVSEYRVTEVGEGYADLAIHKDSAYRVEDGKLIWVGEGWTETTGLAQELDPETGFVRRRRDPLVGMEFEELEPYLVRAKGKVSVKAGRIYQVRNTFRDYAAVFTRRSRNVTWRDVHFRFLHGMGLVSQFSENLTFERVAIAPDPASGRTTAAWADGIHLSGCRGMVKVIDCRFRGTHDDAINVHGTHLRVVEKMAPNEVMVRFIHHQTFGFLGFNPGDEIKFVSDATLATYGANKVKEARMVSPTDIHLVLENPVPDDFAVGDAMENITWTPSVEIRGCHLSHIPTRGFLITTRRPVLVEDNEFHGTHMPAILIEGDASGWHESGGVRDMIIRKNRFIRCNAPVLHIHPRNKSPNDSVHRNIRIVDNEFVLRGPVVLKARSTNGLVFRGNIIRTQGEIDREKLVVTDNCDGVVIEGTVVK